MTVRVIALAALLCGLPLVWRVAADEGAVPSALKAEAACLDRVNAGLTRLLERPADPLATRDLVAAVGAVADGSIREAILFTVGVALAARGDPDLPAFSARLTAAYPASRYAERLQEASRTAPGTCAATCGKNCPRCNGTGTPAPAPALKSMADEALYLIRTRTRAMLDEGGSADVRDSGRNLTPPELKPALKAFADWMLMQQRRLEVRIVSRLYAAREGNLAVLCMTVTPEFSSQDYDWRLTIAKACVKDWAVKCKDLRASAGFRLYDENGNIVGDYNYRNGRVWLPKDGEPPRTPAPEQAQPTVAPPSNTTTDDDAAQP